MNRKHVVWVDTARYFCILAVMAEHTAFITGTLDAFVEPFFLNMFSFCAGYVYLHRGGFGAFLKKKIRQLLIPWFLFSMLIILSAHLISFGEHTDVGEKIIRNMLQIRYYDDEMWYISALFIAFIPFFGLVSAFEQSKAEMQKKIWFTEILVLFLAVCSLGFSRFAPRDLFPWSSPSLPVTLPWHLEYMFQAVFFMFQGYLFHTRFETGFDCLEGGLFCVALWVLYLLLVFAVPILAGELNELVDLFYTFLTAIVGIAAVTSLSKLIPYNRYISYVGSNTLIYYGLHGKMESLLQHVMKARNPEMFSWLQWSGTEWAIVPAVLEALLISVLLIPVVYVINRWFPFMLGRTAAKKM